MSYDVTLAPFPAEGDPREFLQQQFHADEASGRPVEREKLEAVAAALLARHPFVRLDGTDPVHIELHDAGEGVLIHVFDREVTVSISYGVPQVFTLSDGSVRIYDSD